MQKPRLIIFASGTKTGGGSGFENLIQASRTGIVDAEIVAVVSSREAGGVREKAERLGIPFEYFSGPYTAEEYQRIVAKYTAEYASLSGWLKFVRGLDPRTTINIHPGPVHGFGGDQMFGDHVHEAVLAAYARGELTHTAVTMHFVTEEKYDDEAAVFYEKKIEILPSDTLESLRKRVNAVEHQVQPILTNLVVHGKIRWDGKNRDSIVVPENLP